LQLVHGSEFTWNDHDIDLSPDHDNAFSSLPSPAASRISHNPSLTIPLSQLFAPLSPLAKSQNTMPSLTEAVMKVLVKLYHLFVSNERSIRQRSAEAVKQLTVNQVFCATDCFDF
jgi:hypothetical protein